MRLNSRLIVAMIMLIVIGAKLFLVWQLPLFGDEAFYWLESQQPALGYSDVPPLTPWLIALGGWTAPDTVIGVRWPSLLLSCLIPFLVFGWARRFVSDGDARAAAAWSLLMPLSAGLGVLALPDVAMTCAVMLLTLALSNAVDSGRWRDWIVVGIALAVGWLAHYRFALILLAGMVFLLGMPRGRLLWRGGGFWVAQAIGLVGLLPALWFNFGHQWSALRFQFIDRHPWTFHISSLVEPAVQAVMVTPALFVLLLAAIHRAWQRRLDRSAPYDLLAAAAGGLLIVHLGIGLFADAERVRFHWPLPAWLLALPLVPLIARDWRERSSGIGRLKSLVAITAVPLALAGTLILFGLLLQATRPATAEFAPLGRPLPDNLQGWREIGRWARSTARGNRQATLIADHFMGAAQIDFVMRDARPVYSLDHPLNRKHGRAVQLSIMGRGEAALQASGWREGLLFFEETSRREIERVPAALALCERFGSVRWIGEKVLFGGRWRWHAFAVKPRSSTALAQPCELPAMADLSTPLPDAVVDIGQLSITGWAIEDFDGISSVEVLIDGQRRATAEYGVEFSGVRGQWPMSRDPFHPHVGLHATVQLNEADAGTRLLSLRVTDRRGVVRELAIRKIRVRAPAT